MNDYFCFYKLFLGMAVLGRAKPKQNMFSVSVMSALPTLFYCPHSKMEIEQIGSCSIGLQRRKLYLENARIPVSNSSSICCPFGLSQ